MRRDPFRVDEYTRADGSRVRSPPLPESQDGDVLEMTFYPRR